MTAQISTRNSGCLVDFDKRFRQPLWGFFFRRTRSCSDADDLVQEVFCRLSRADRGNVVKPANYVFAVAANLLRDHHKKAIQAPSMDAEIHDVLKETGIAFDPERILLGRDQLDRLEAILAEMPERTRAILLLHRLDNMKQRAIADHLGISTSAVEKHLARASQHLARRWRP